MTARRCVFAALLALSLGGFAIAQPPGRDLGPEDVRRVGDWLRAANGSTLPPEIRKAIEDFLKSNNRPTPQQLQDFAKKLSRDNPQLQQNSKQYEAMREFLERSGGLTRPKKLPDLGSTGSASKPGERPKGPPASLKLPEEPPKSPESGPEGVAAAVGGNTATPPTPPTGPRGPESSIEQPPSGYGSQGSPEGQKSRERQHRNLEAVTGWWEQNVGPLDETPAVRQLLVELVTGQGGASAEGSLGDLLDGRNAAGEKTGLGKAAESLGASDWKLPELGLGRMDFDSPAVGGSMPSAPNGPSFGEFGGDGGDSWLPVVILGVVALLALILWWVWPRLRAQGTHAPRPRVGLGPWPVDPRTIADREALVRAFEYLSVLRCGSSARMWNHRSIADGLRQAVPTASADADPLAELYSVARYAPVEEALPPTSIVDARRHLCRIAGVKPV